MSECTACTYYGKHLEGPSSVMPYPCSNCAGGEQYVERGSRPKKKSLRAQLAEYEQRVKALEDALRDLLERYVSAIGNEGPECYKARKALEATCQN